jgi:hypothetical protein
MKKETLILMVVTLVVGALIGMILSNTNKDTAPATVNQSPASAPAVNYQQ